MPEESNFSNTPTAALQLLTGALRLLAGAAIAMELGPGRATALQPSSPRARLLRVRSPQGESTELMRPTELMALKHLHLTTLSFRWLHRNSGGAVLLPLAPSGAEQ